MREDFFIDALDIEWCLRAKSLGYEVAMTNKAMMKHSIGEEANNKIEGHSPFREFYICRNSIAMIGLSHIPIGFKMRRIVLTHLRILYSLFNLKLEYAKAGIRGCSKGYKYIFNKTIK